MPQKHYNPALNKCFVRMENRVANSRVGLQIDVSVYDAFERKKWAGYSLSAQPGEDSRKVPIFCGVVPLTGGDMKRCESETEFENIVRTYME